MDSNPEVRDSERTGDDLLARIDELSAGVAGPGDGWRHLLWACGREISSLRSELRGISEAIRSRERNRCGLTGGL